MVSTLWYLAQLFTFLLGGMLLAKIQVIPQSSEHRIDQMLSWCLYALLFAMGVRTGLIDDIFQQAGRMGALAVGFGAVTSIFSIAAVIIGTRTAVFLSGTLGYSKKSVSSGGNNSSTLRSRFREPVRLIFCAVLGVLLSSLTPWFNWFDDRITTGLLFILLTLVGIQMVQGKADMFSVFRQPISLFLPLLTVVGTLLGGWFLGLFVSLGPGESMAIAAGFGWYSLSGVLIAEMGSPVLGSVAFLSNLFREIIACVTIPLLAGVKFPHAAISVAGATSMDVTLPIIEHSCGAEYVPLALAHGILLTILVPFLVPLLFFI